MTGADQATVLVVDDEPQLLELFARYLADRYDVRTAASGEEALAELDDSVDVVLLDRRMPDRSGDEVLDAMRDRGFDGLVTMVTAVDPDLDITELGFDDYLVKPVSETELTDAVETLLRRATYDDRMQEYFALVSKLAVLQAEHSGESLERSPQYRALTDRLDAVQTEARETLSAMSPAETEAVFRELADAEFAEDLQDGP